MSPLNDLAGYAANQSYNIEYIRHSSKQHYTILFYHRLSLESSKNRFRGEVKKLKKVNFTF
jgi:hypothetical protein